MTAQETTTGGEGGGVVKKKRKGLWWKVLLAILGVGALGVVLLPTLLSMGPGNRWLLGQVNGRIAGSVSAESLSLGWLSGVKARGVELKDPDGGTVVKVGQVDTGLTVLDALTPASMDLGNVVLRGGVIALKTGADGKTNLDRALASKGEQAGGEKPAKVPVPVVPPGERKGILVRGTIDGELDSVTAVTGNAPPLIVEKTTIKGRVDTSGPLELDVAGRAINPDKSPAAFAVRLNGSPFENGTLKNLDQLRGNGDVTLESLDLAGITALLKARGVDLQISGIAGGKIVLADSAGKQTVNGHVEISKSPTFTGGLLQGDTLRLKACTAEVGAVLSGETVEVQKLSVATDVGNVTASGVVKVSEATGTLPPLTVKGMVDVTALKKQLPKRMGNVPDTQVKVDVTGAADLAKKTFTVTGDSLVGEQDVTTGQGNTVQLAKGSVVSWGDAPNDVTGKVVYALGRVRQILAKQLPEGAVLEGNRTMAIRLTGPLTQDKGLRALRRLSLARTAIGEDRVSMSGIELGKGDVGLEMKEGVLTILPSDIPANGGTLHVRGTVDFNADPPALVIKKEQTPVGIVRDLKINQEVAAGPLAFLPLLWGSQALDSKGKGGTFAQVGGLFNLRLEEAYVPLDGDLFKQKGTAVGSFDVRDLMTESPLFAEIAKQLGPVMKLSQPDLLAIKNGEIPTVPFSLKDGRISYQNLILGTQKEQLKFSGWVGMDGSLAMNINIALQSEGLGGLGKKLGGGKGVNMAIPVTITGTIRKPSVKVEITQDTVNQTIENVAPLIDDLLKKKRK